MRSYKPYITTAPALPPGLCFSSQEGSQYFPSEGNLWNFRFLPSSNCRGTTYSSHNREESWLSFPRVLLAGFAPAGAAEALLPGHNPPNPFIGPTACTEQRDFHMAETSQGLSLSSARSVSPWQELHCLHLVLRSLQTIRFLPNKLWHLSHRVGKFMPGNTLKTLFLKVDSFWYY